MESTVPQFVEVYRARHAPEAHAMRLGLEAAGLIVKIEGDLLQGAIGDLPMGWVTSPRILVEASQEVRARGLIAQGQALESDQSDDDGQAESTLCLACGQSMEDAVSKCPSCGWSYFGDETEG